MHISLDVFNLACRHRRKQLPPPDNPPSGWRPRGSARLHGIACHRACDTHCSTGSILAVWLHIGDSLLFHHATPYTYKYGTVDTYQEHGNDIRSRIELETPLSSLSGVQWSRNDIFRAPLGRNPLTRHGQPIVRVNLFNPQQTGMPAATMDELASVTLGSFQLRLVRSYSTSLRYYSIIDF